ncbi:hypothetical protein KEM52_004044, partial [Ascosphaera acerosa]
MNGVLNTDNTSVLGLSLDFGPFAFMDTFDARFTPNHDDGQLRYCYRNQPQVIWWNLVRFGEALAELIGAGGRVDDPAFVEGGVADDDEAALNALTERAEKIILAAGDEYTAVFTAEYAAQMARRLGLEAAQHGDFVPSLVSPAL